MAIPNVYQVFAKLIILFGKGPVAYYTISSYSYSAFDDLVCRKRRDLQTLTRLAWESQRMQNCHRGKASYSHTDQEVSEKAAF